MKKVRKVLLMMKETIDYCENFALRFRYKERRSEPLHPGQQEAASPPERGGEAIAADLLLQLKEGRKQMAMEENLPPYRICNDATLEEMAACLPQTMNDMAMIRGMGDFTLSRYGEIFLRMIQKFTEHHQLESNMHLLAGMQKSRKRKSATGRPAKSPAAGKAGNSSQMQSLQLFQSGKSVAEIAALRNFSSATIEAHLAHYVKTGALDVFKLISAEKFEAIKEAVQKAAEPGLTPIKMMLGDAVSYGEIRFVIAAMNSEERKDGDDS